MTIGSTDNRLSFYRLLLTTPLLLLLLLLLSCCLFPLSSISNSGSAVTSQLATVYPGIAAADVPATSVGEPRNSLPHTTHTTHTLSQHTLCKKYTHSLAHTLISTLTTHILAPTLPLITHILSRNTFFPFPS